MAIFAISDLHLSLSTDKPMDIFNGWDNYVSRIKENWIATVNETDTVVICGDISWALKLKDTYADLEFINSLPGKKILIKGNHDLWWDTKKKLEDYISENKFENIKIIFNNFIETENIAICGSRGWIVNPESESDKKIFKRELGRLKISLESTVNTGLKPVVFLHYPPIYGNIICHQVIDILHDYGVKRCYYGHIHGKDCSNKIIIGEYDGIYFDLVSCDYINFKPLKIN